METYLPQKIGRCISWAGDHFVYEYGNDEVIKFSKFDHFFGYQKALAKYRADDEVCKKFFGEYLLETRILTNGRKIAFVQRKIEGRFLAAGDLKDPVLREQYDEIISAYYRLHDEGHAQLDLVGGKGALNGTMSNIFVTPGRRLVIFDASLLSLRDVPRWSWPLFWPLFLLADVFHRSRIKQFQNSSQSN